MNKEFVEQQKSSLLAEKNNLENDIKEIARKKDPESFEFEATYPEYGRNQEDNATEEEEHSVRAGVEESLEKKLRNINHALERIDSGSYGVCEKCGKEISEKRLAAMPSASGCVEHMNEF